MIPKIIHYCWLSDDSYPDKIKRCINSWDKFCPDFEKRLWNLEREEVCNIPWVKEAFDAKKYAFAADYIRCFALYKFGGVYLDSDVEVMKDISDLLIYPYFIGKETSGGIEAAIIGVEPKNFFIKEILNYYQNRHFKISENSYDEKTLPDIMWEILSKKFEIKEILNPTEIDVDLKCITILPAYYFSPKNYYNGEVNIREETYTIHHFSASWHSTKQKLYKAINRVLGNTISQKLSKIYRKYGNRKCR